MCMGRRLSCLTSVYLVYSNHDGLLDAFAAYWRHVVEEFTNEPNVIGYEIINEPW